MIVLDPLSLSYVLVAGAGFLSFFDVAALIGILSSLCSFTTGFNLSLSVSIVGCCLPCLALNGAMSGCV